MRATNAEAPCEISKPVLEQASQSSRALKGPRCVSRRPAACPPLDLPGHMKTCHSANYLTQKVFSVLFPGSFSSQVIGAPKPSSSGTRLPSLFIPSLTTIAHSLFVHIDNTKIRNGQSTVGGPKWTKMASSGQNGPK